MYIWECTKAFRLNVSTEGLSACNFAKGFFSVVVFALRLDESLIR